MTTDYRDTVFLPRTDFPMKADLPRREPDLAARWEGMDLYARLREASAGREKFVLHDGPPYANAHIHMGTALNKILKDVVNRSQQMLSKDAPYVPGWDCHGLPIEWQIEQEYRKKGNDKDAVPIADFQSVASTISGLGPFFAQHIGAVVQDLQDGLLKDPGVTVQHFTGAAPMNLQAFVQAHHDLFTPTPN